MRIYGINFTISLENSDFLTELDFVISLNPAYPWRYIYLSNLSPIFHFFLPTSILCLHFPLYFTPFFNFHIISSNTLMFQPFDIFRFLRDVIDFSAASVVFPVAATQSSSQAKYLLIQERRRYQRLPRRRYRPRPRCHLR